MSAGLFERLYIALAPWLLPILESLLLLAALALTFLSRKKIPAFLPITGRFAQLARRKTLAVAVVGLATLTIRIALIPVWGVPQPAWHDEFSFLLAADTFAHGRLSNPPHPMWMHLESFHVIQQPTYMSMYPPGQGLLLAAGQLLGNPWIGQLLTTALMCSCLCWMLQAWLPPRWALLGACLAVLRLGLLSYWMNSYFATSLPAFGGMLLLGALPRIKKHRRVWDALLFGLGLAILANTRPYEGFVYSVPITAALIVWIVSRRGRNVFAAVAFPIVLLLAITAAGMGYYFWRVTGNPIVMPYSVNRQTYAIAPYFVWQKPRPEPVYRHAEMRDFYVNFEEKSFEEGWTISGFAWRITKRVGMLWSFYVGPVFTLALLAFPSILHDSKMRLPLAAAGVVIAGNLIETWTLVHYLAPAVGLFFLLMLQCLRHLRTWQWRGRHIGQGFARAIVTVCVAMVALRIMAMAAGARIEAPRNPPDPHRIEVQHELQSKPGKQLVIVHYGPNHIPHDDWINNRADIDGSKIVWARDMGGQNHELLQYFKDRHAWVINADDPHAKLEPYGDAVAAK